MVIGGIMNYGAVYAKVEDRQKVDNAKAIYSDIRYSAFFFSQLSKNRGLFFPP